MIGESGARGRRVVRDAPHPVLWPGGAMADQPTVYVVDDDPLTVSLLVHWLERASLRAERYDSAEAFLAQYDGAPGCLLLDVQMPGMSGLDLQRQLNDRGTE